MRYSNIPDFCRWARSYEPRNIKATLVGPMFGGSIFIAATRIDNELELHHFIAMPRGMGIVTEALNRIEFLLPDKYIRVSTLTNPRFMALLMRRGYLVTGKGEVTLPAKVSRYQQRSA